MAARRINLSLARRWSSQWGSLSRPSASPWQSLHGHRLQQRVSLCMAPSTLTAARAASTTAAAQAPMYFHSSAHWGAAHDLAEAARDESLAQVFAQFSENGDTVDRTRIGEVLATTLPTATISQELTDKMLLVADLDNNGSIDFYEFCRLFEEIPDEDISVANLAEFWLRHTDLGNPDVLFSTVWRKVHSRAADPDGVVPFPQEVLWLSGAPGSGKGTHSEYIVRNRTISGAISVSSLLNSPHAQKVKARGGLVGDLEVMDVLCDAMVRPKYSHGVLVDGFPRTSVQADVIRLLYDRVVAQAVDFGLPRPRFRVVVLFIDEPTSIRRQLLRGQRAQEHNAQVEATGVGEKIKIRETDISVAAARLRYKTFVEQTLNPLNALKDVFAFNVIDTSGTIEECERTIHSELKYQSSLELASETHATLTNIPTVTDLTTHLRQNLVRRLDSYQANHAYVFAEVCNAIVSEVIPVIQRHAMVGAARIRTKHTSFDLPLARDILVDVLADRGFQAVTYRDPVDDALVVDIHFHVKAVVDATPH